MDWLHKLRKALIALSATLKLRRSLGGGVAGGVGGERGGGIGGLLKLQDDVQMCGYEDVQIMWNMLSKAQHEEVVVSSPTTTTKPNKKRRHAKSPVLVRLETCSVEKAKH
ncbi:hypothetical protein ACFX15_012598 [Malus domestica]|uniref:uncharacterized protein LOC126596197 n=1 Tax=Malus sylvestris TaxID=3752 RepID=UPI0021ACC0D2|nr:uncharacterized protein LOC126596197 [Malus sylvestris]